MNTHRVFLVAHSAGATECVDSPRQMSKNSPSKECHRYNTKPSDGEVPVLKPFGMQCTHSLTLLPRPI